MALDGHGNDLVETLRADDDALMQHLNTGDKAFLTFLAPEAQANMKNTVFLHSKGYYEQIVESDQSPQYLKLLSFSRAGSYAKYSKDLYFELLNSSEEVAMH
jgi:uncharacterized protein YbgA (DUF1722 family)